MIDVHRSADGPLELEAWKPGQYELALPSGSKRLEVPVLPEPTELDGPWSVRFTPGRGVANQAAFPELQSWSQNADPGIKYYSGEAAYTRTIELRPELFGPSRRVYLDLGRVEVMARIRLNGKDLGTVWKPPYLVDLTSAAHPGSNALEVQVVNLWINRLIGDEQLPEDSPRNPNGTLKEWPRWLNEGKTSPTGRSTFTAWRLWKKTDVPVASGLLGPVRLLATERFSVALD